MSFLRKHLNVILNRIAAGSCHLHNIGNGYVDGSIHLSIHFHPFTQRPSPPLPDAKVEGRCPPEDVGGPLGYEEFLEAIADPHHDRHAELHEW